MWRRGEVSIPFKRESISKDGQWALTMGVGNYMFQFPSNGKVYPKRQNEPVVRVATTSFNSLQTGKYIQSNPVQ